MAVARFKSVALDCVDPLALAQFWADLIGGKIVFSNDDFAAVQVDGMYITAMRVADYHVPTWPEQSVPKQIHLDLSVDDLDSAEAAAVQLGARKAAEQPSPSHWRVLLDPAGHPFCLSTQIPE